ncbi:GFA family protein [Rhizobiaceae bacterium n13]|uniref:GFA family protein n=1 Tax=Ferirhizobium litorale TaxID=2927786 RepID=A0AAE3U356_9HYPH|nr:GFA family protein [Fererhizobium litorale]MDI7863872.1 GFA family protein [Fererhizobium litorale]MDI7924296.1 GFA family protein [Fererhizobium litorale]
MNQVNEGSCLCGAVRFRTKGPLREVVACHCSQCRKQTGLYYAATNVGLDNFELDGEERVTWYRASDFARRGFCGTCGSALFWQADDADHVSIMAGAFDGEPGLKMAYHIFCADKGDFYEINDGLPQYGKGSPNLAVAPDD